MEKFSELKYTRPDFAKLKSDVKEAIKALKSAKSYEEFKKIYLELNQKMYDVSTMGTIVSIRNTINMQDEFYDKEDKYINTQSASLSLTMKKVMQTILASPYRKEIDAEFGSLLLKSAEMQLKLISFKVIFKMIKENNLGKEYSKAVALCKCNFRGEECNFYGLLKHMENPDREIRKEAFLAWAKMYEEVSPKLDAIYDKLVALRVKTAKALGFKDYIEYVYLARGRFDYNAADVNKFREAVKREVVPLCAELYQKQAARLGLDELQMYDEALVYPNGNATPIGSTTELVEKARNMYHELSPETGEFFDFMAEYELFDLETKPGKHMGGYCTFLPNFKAPFIFSNFNGTSADVDVLTHEAGHAFEAYYASRHLPLLELVHSTSEINEIHSMAMEQFTYPWMDKFFCERTDEYRYAHLCGTMTTIPYLVAVDEFQHKVFENPKMSAKERRSVWHQIELDYMPWRHYDGNKFLSEGGFWMQKQHIFLYPFYYVDYALAQTCASQLFIKSTKNHKEAWDNYLALCSMGGKYGYFETLEKAGLDNPFKEDTVKKVVESIRGLIDEFEAKLNK